MELGPRQMMILGILLGGANLHDFDQCWDAAAKEIGVTAERIYSQAVALKATLRRDESYHIGRRIVLDLPPIKPPDDR